jgi:hypothetical protein
MQCLSLRLLPGLLFRSFFLPTGAGVCSSGEKDAPEGEGTTAQDRNYKEDPHERRCLANPRQSYEG